MASLQPGAGAKTRIGGRTEGGTRVGRRKEAVPPRLRSAGHRGFNLSIYMLCECGQERLVGVSISRGGIDHTQITAPCCLRRYRVVGWGENGPMLKCMGVESWGSDRTVKIVPVIGETTSDDAEIEMWHQDRLNREPIRSVWPPA